jgi:Pyruvate/2-oxoacid:ferredoxin oxidoreductase delta subunit
MPLTDQSPLRIVLYEGGDAQPLPADERFAALTALLDKGFAVTRLANQGAVAPADPSPILILGHFAGGHPSEPSGSREGVPIRFQNVAALDPNRIVELVEAARLETHAAKPGEWKPWFPVIDYDRCTNCMQCLSFCLFGVYGVDAQQKIEVQSAESCKTNCPACSRVCPEAAIVFPKYKSGPINGDVVSDADLAREKMKIDISALLGGDIYSLLRDRSEKARSRFSKERDSNKALQERQKCLAKLAQAAEIPPEVLMALPSPEEIQRRAKEAKAKAQAALARQT